MKIPKLHKGSFFLSLFEPRRRIDQASYPARTAGRRLVCFQERLAQHRRQWNPSRLSR